MRCIYTNAVIEPGQTVALSPLGPVTLLALTNTTDGEPLSTDVLVYGSAVLRAYLQRRGWLQPVPEQMSSMTDLIFKRLRAIIPAGESRYIHQLLLQVDIVPWLSAMRQPLQINSFDVVNPPSDPDFNNQLNQ